MLTTGLTSRTAKSPWAGLCVLIFAVGCDPFSGPYLHNGLDVMVEIHVEHPGGESYEFELLPNGYVLMGRQYLKAQRTRIVVGGTDFLTVSRNDITALVGERDPETVGITIEEAGLRLLSKSELDAIGAAS